MATSTIFEPIVIDDPEMAEKFITMLDENAKKPLKERPDMSFLITDPEEIKKLRIVSK